MTFTSLEFIFFLCLEVLWKFRVTESSGTPLCPPCHCVHSEKNRMAIPTPSILSSLQPAWKRKTQRWAGPLPLRRLPRSCVYHIGLHPIGQDLIMWLQCKGGCERESSFQVAMCSAKHLFLRKRRINTGIKCWLFQACLLATWISMGCFSHTYDILLSHGNMVPSSAQLVIPPASHNS